jgi:hypothetical protein
LTKDFESRLWAKVDKTAEGGCWIWTACLNDAGYGMIGVSGKPRRAHRVVYELTYGSIPDGKELDHICRVRRCVNPNHLRPVSRRENLTAPGSLAIIAKYAATYTCVNGHSLTDPENVRIKVNTAVPGKHLKRECRACQREFAERKRRRDGRKPNPVLSASCRASALQRRVLDHG